MSLLHAALHRVADDAVVHGERAFDSGELVAVLVQLAVRQLNEPSKISQPLLRAAAEQQEFVGGEGGAQARGSSMPWVAWRVCAG